MHLCLLAWEQQSRRYPEAENDTNDQLIIKPKLVCMYT